MALPLLAIAQMLLDMAAMLVMIAAIIAIAGVVKDFLVVNLVDILTDMPGFDYSFQNGVEDGNVLFHIYDRHRDMVVLPLLVIAGITWLFTGRFGHRVESKLGSEQVKENVAGVPGFMRSNIKDSFIKATNSPVISTSFGSDQSGGAAPGKRAGWFTAWVSGLPSRCVLFVVLLFILPPLWDASVDASEWAAGVILNPVYSGNDAYPCPAGWYSDGELDTSNPELLEHYREVRWLLMQDKTGQLDAMCMPELPVRYMLEQWGGHTKAIPPPLDHSGSVLDLLSSIGENAADWIIRGFGEFFINILLSVVKAQAVVMSGTTMIFSNIVVDVAVATMIVFAPFWCIVMIVPWERIGGSKIKTTFNQFAPAILAAAVIYPIEVAVLFAVASNMMVSLLLSDYGNNLLIVWLFGTSVMSLVIAMPIVTLGAFANVLASVTGQFTGMMQTAQSALGYAAGAGSARLGAKIKAGGTAGGGKQAALGPGGAGGPPGGGGAGGGGMGAANMNIGAVGKKFGSALSGLTSKFKGGK